MVRNTMVHYSALFVGLQVQDASLRLALRNKLTPECSNELLRVSQKVSREAVNTKVQCSQIFDSWVVTEDTNVCTWSQA